MSSEEPFCSQPHQSQDVRKKHQLQGGYECIFVKDPPDHLQTECSVCLCVLKEPYLVGCCGNSFCKTCIEPIKVDDKPCPLCNVQFTTCIPDKRLQRTLNELQVYCCHKEAGCEWVGELSNLSQHLNIVFQSSDAERLIGCSFVSIDCTFCDQKLQRQEMKDHETNKCPQRPYSCDYCNDYESTCEDVTTNHWQVCPSRPVPCPNECRTYPERKSLQDHLSGQCALAVISCPFDYAGCTQKFPRKDMEIHIMENLALHMSLQAVNHKQQLEAYQGEIAQLKDQVQILEKEKKVLEKQTQEQLKDLEAQLKLSSRWIEELKEGNQLLRRQADEHNRDITLMKSYRGYRSFEDVKAEVASYKTDMIALHTHLGLLPVEVTMREFETSRANEIKWFSNPFYTHSHGYKLCLCVYPNGQTEGHDTHVSIYVYIMRGEFDDEVNWPFKGVITVDLQASIAWEAPFTTDIRFSGATPSCNRVVGPGQERGGTGRGYPKFISHHELEHQYLKDDTLIFRISRSKLSR